MERGGAQPVGVRDGDSATLITGTPGADRVDAGGGADAVGTAAGPDVIDAGRARTS